MPSAWKITLKNDVFSKLLEHNRQQAGKVVRKTGLSGIGYIKQAIVSTGSVDTGAMLNSVDEVPKPAPFIFIIGIGVGYWQFTNNGTRRIPPRYWLEQGVNDMLAEFDEAMSAFGRRTK